jgi:gamma-glutamyl hercynylcysteine S-oxide synthase
MSEKKITEQTINRLIEDLKDARKRTLELVAGLDGQQIMGPQLDIVNPLLWEIGHVAYFHELWTLRHLDGAESYLENADQLYDSISIAHADRWQLPLLSLDETETYMQQVLDAEIARLKRDGVTSLDMYLTRYAVFHEDMHTEAYTYSRRTLSYPAPVFADSVLHDEAYDAGPLDGDIEIEGGRFLMGAEKNIDFCFDNEKWQHPVSIKPFAIARAATSYQQYAAFVDDGGYEGHQYWDDEGWNWLKKNKLDKPDGWKKHTDNNWLIKQFDQWQAMRPHAAVIHISWFEAMAWCRWAGRRLPSEAEWELAASGSPENINEKRTYPWGDQQPDARRVNMDSRAMRTIDVGALPGGDSAFGCRQMLGNVWEWTADTFEPYPGFIADMYRDYSQPLFGQTKVLRGGAWPTRSRMIRNTWRNYYGPDRNDVFAGFRSCAL